MLRRALYIKHPSHFAMGAKQKKKRHMHIGLPPLGARFARTSLRYLRSKREWPRMQRSARIASPRSVVYECVDVCVKHRAAVAASLRRL
jgi:hypothetical protein